MQSIGLAGPFEGLDYLKSVRIRELFVEELQLVENGRRFHDSLIRKLITGKIGRIDEDDGVQKIQINLNRLVSTSYRPDARQLEFLKEFYGHLQALYDLKKELAVKHEIFIHGVRLNMERLKFADYHFERRLAAVYRHNHRHNQLQLEPCWSVSEVRYVELPEILELITVRDDPRQAEHCERRFIELMRIFPNLRVVIVENPNKLQLEPCSFVTFLTLCQALTELRLITPGFHQAFYDRLVDMQSLRTLHRFVLIETHGFAYVLTDFKFLNCDYLRHLRTNLATRAVMLECVFKKMNQSADFEFQFCNPANASQCRHFRFQKLDHDRWDVSIFGEDFREPHHKFRHSFNGVHTYDELLWLSQSKNLHLTSHWLDVIEERVDDSPCRLI